MNDRFLHDYQGLCPDETQPDCIDPECAACERLLLGDALLALAADGHPWAVALKRRFVAQREKDIDAALDKAFAQKEVQP